MKYPLGIQTFSKIINDKLLYIDKTAIVYDLLARGSVYFLSRPRRFGKSLLISTFEALFSGQKALFEGLAIADTDYDFAVHPVIKLEFTKDEFATADNLRSYIFKAINRIASDNVIELVEDTYTLRFDELVVKLHQKTGQNVVLLIDEYDKPILNNLNQPMLAEIKKVTNAFYSVVKSLDEHLRFVFITGVSKFAKVSVFSGMNSLTDISMDKRYATLCGVTQQELESNFNEAIDKLAGLEELDRAQMLAKIKQWYNGYCFHHRAQGVYNPYSVLSLFEFEEFNNYWFTTATPTFLLDLLQSKQYDLQTLTLFEVGEASFAASEPEHMHVQSVFLQTGHLTIKGYNGTVYTLDFPNLEVKKSFYDSVSARYAQVDPGEGQVFSYHLIQNLNAGRLDAFFETLGCFFANIPYDITLANEKYYQSLFYAVLTLMGLSIEAEVRSNKGCIDCVLQTDEVIYIIEFKLNGTKEQALQQIQDKQYAQKYQGSDKRVVLLGVEFDQSTRNLGGFVQL
jgi:hypothetical protein